MKKLRAHNVAVEVNGYKIEHWTRYSITTSMLEPADGFDMEIGPVTQDLYTVCAPDCEVKVSIDGTVVLTGYIDERVRSGGRNGSTLQITGRDKGGRLVDESMPLASFATMDLEDLAKNAVWPWFSTVTFSNAENRALVRGKRGGKAKANSEPAIIFDTKKAPKKVSPGETHWQVLLNWLGPAKLLGWSTADGTKIVIGEPNYSQEAQFAFFAPKKGSKRAKFGNVVDFSERTSVADRYSRITVLGTCKGDSSNYSRNLIKNHGSARDGTNEDGTGADFDHRKTLIISDDAVKSVQDAEDRAEREMAIRDATGEVLELTVAGHGQVRSAGMVPTIFAFDTVATWEDEEIGLHGRYLITEAVFSCGRDEAEVTRLTLVPEGTVLTQ